MKNLEELKMELSQDIVKPLYIFYGEDYGIRKHYVNRLKTYFKKSTMLDSCRDLSNMLSGGSLFKIKQLYIIHSDTDILTWKLEQINTLIERLKDDTLILIYEEPVESSVLFKEYDKYVTNFPTVQDKIAEEFIDSEISLARKDKEDFAFNCRNNYNNILLECDKIRNYAKIKGITEQTAYESLKLKEQLLREYLDFDCNNMMDLLLQGDLSDLPYWLCVIREKGPEKFYYSLTYIFTDYLIAYYIVTYGTYAGSSRAFNQGLSWTRAKIIRDFKIPYTADYLLNAAYSVAKLDSEVKLGKVSREEIIDKFIDLIV